MKQHKDHAIILSRVDYAERDRILTMLCEKAGKVSVLAKGVRVEKSRLAGGIELLSESEVSFVDTRSDLKTLTGARLTIHFGNLTSDMRRMQQAFAIIKVISSLVEDGDGQEYYQVLLTALAKMNDRQYDPRIVESWFNLTVLKISGTAPNMSLDDTSGEQFEFDYDNQQFMAKPYGAFTKNDLKLLRLCLKQVKPPILQKELGSEDRLLSLTRSLLKTNVTEV